MLDMGFERNVWRWANAHPGCNLICNIAYTALPVAIALGIATSPAPRAAARSMLQAGVIGVIAYYFFPAEGPRAHMLHQVGAAHNCIPSLHLSWAAIAAASSGKHIRYYLWPFVAATAVVTITTGEHYFLDLFAAVPLVLLCLWMNQRKPVTAALTAGRDYAIGAYPAA